MLTIWISFLPRFDLVWFGSVYVDDVDIIHTFMNILNQKTFENGWNEWVECKRNLPENDYDDDDDDTV